MTAPEGRDWDAFVEANPLGSYMQLRAWAEVKRWNGWSAADVRAASGAGEIGAQVLLRRPGALPWTYAYAPRGPVATTWNAESIRAFTEAARRDLRKAAPRISHLRIDPEIERDGPNDPDGSTRAALRAAGWRQGASVQVNSTRVIDLAPPEEELWSGVRKKWRQYVNKARSAGVQVVEADGSRLDEFYAIQRETAGRASFAIRSEASYRAIWEAFAPQGAVRLLFAEEKPGEAIASLFLVRCGTRVVEPFGGMTARGAESRANYLLKWEAIRSSREAGATVYDMWGGLMIPGIAYFKEGFGGRVVEYIGAWDLVFDRLGWFTYAPLRRAVLNARELPGRLLRHDGGGAGREPMGGADT